MKNAMFSNAPGVYNGKPLVYPESDSVVIVNELEPFKPEGIDGDEVLDLENESKMPIIDTYIGTGDIDPTGKDLHEGGAKGDKGKPRVALVMRDFAHALWEVARVGTYGAEKYCESGWTTVPDGFNRYDDALMRHKLKDWMGEKMDTDLPVEHLAQVAWNALAMLERRICEEKNNEA